MSDPVLLSLPEPVAPPAAGSVEAQEEPMSSASSGRAWLEEFPPLHQIPASHTLRSGPPVEEISGYIQTIHEKSII